MLKLMPEAKLGISSKKMAEFKSKLQNFTHNIGKFNLVTLISQYRHNGE